MGWYVSNQLYACNIASKENQNVLYHVYSQNFHPKTAIYQAGTHKLLINAYNTEDLNFLVWDNGLSQVPEAE